MIGWLRKPDAKLLILCTANICRSPAAEALLRRALRQRGLGRRVRVRSAGTAVGSPGASPDPRMVAIAAEAGLSMRSLRAEPLTEETLEWASAIYVMEPRHREAVLELLPDAGERCELIDPDGDTIGDPYFGNKAGVRAAFERLAYVAEQRAGEWERRLTAAVRIER